MERTPATNTHLRYDEDGSAVSAADFFLLDSESNNVSSDLAGIATNLNRTHLGSPSRNSETGPTQLETLISMMSQLSTSLQFCKEQILQLQSAEVLSRSITQSPPPVHRSGPFSSSPLASNISEPIPVDQSAEQLSAKTEVKESMVPRTEYPKTNTFNVDSLKKISIGLSTPDVHDKIKSIIRILDLENLLTMANGDRKKPMPTPANLNGYSPVSVVIDVDSGEYISHKKDDIHLYEHDSKRLTSLLLFAFDKSIYHLHPTAFSLGDNLKMYSSVMEYFNGQQTKDAHRCQADMTNFKISPLTNPFRQDFYKFSELLDKLKHATKKEIPDEDLHEYLLSKFLSDTRVGVKEALMAGRIARSSCGELVASIIATTDVLIL